MTKTLAVIAVTLALGSSGCVTDPGIPADTDAGRGTIVVWEKNGLHADLYVDYRATGRKTPDTLYNIPAGSHSIHLFYPNHSTVTGSNRVEVQENRISEASFELQKSPSGSCVIETEPAGAVISLNHIDIGTSPLSLEGLPSGIYTMGARLGTWRSADTAVTIGPTATTQVRRTLSLAGSVLIEYFSNTGCPPCPAVGEALERMIADMPQYRDRLSLIAFHLNFPNPVDPLYLYAREDQDARMELYQLSCAPYILINGQGINYDASFVSEAKKRIESEIARTVAADLSFDAIASTSTVVSGRVVVKNGTPTHRLFVALVEEFIGYPEPIGNNKQRLFHDIFRGFPPEANGIEVVLSDMTVPFSIALPPSDSQGEFSLCAWLQEPASLAIVQSRRILIE